MSYPRLANPPAASNETEMDQFAWQLLGVLSHLTTGVAAFGPTGRTRYCTERLVRIVGREPVSLKELIELLGTTDVVREQVKQALADATGTKNTIEIYLHERPLRLTALTLDGEKPLRVALIEDLAHEIKQREQLERLERLATVGQVTAGAAHEFNNNLTSVLGWTQIAIQNTPPGSPASSALDIIEDNAHKAKGIFSRLLDMSRSQTGGVERALVSPEEVVNDALDVLSYELQNAKVTLIRRFNPTQRCYLDVDGLRQVIVNIVRNAIDAMQDGGSLEVGIRMDKSLLKLTFKDNGPGMASEVANQIFDSFFTTKRDSDVPLNGGTGLGLSVSSDIIRRMGGEIKVESLPQAGATFTIVIPHAVGTTSRPSKTSQLNRPTIPPGAVVLVVDDEPDVGEMIRMSLELQGISVIAVSSGEEAVAQLGTIPFDAAFVDYTMPGLSGHALGMEMQKAQPKLPIVFMSGLNVETDHVVGDFIKKPFDLDDIQKKLYEVMKRRKNALIEESRQP